MSTQMFRSGCIAFATALVLLSSQCIHRRVAVDVARRGNHREIHAEFHFLPGNTTTQISVLADTMVVELRNSSDSLVSKSRYRLNKEELPVLDTLLVMLDRVPAKRYVKKQVIDGTRMTLVYGERTIVCDNCLHDYVLLASGLKLARPSGKLADLKSAVGSLNYLARRGMSAGERRKRLEIKTNVKQLTDTTQKYRVDDLDKK